MGFKKVRADDEFRATLDLGGGHAVWAQRPKRGQRIRVTSGGEVYDGRVSAVRQIADGYRIYLRDVSRVPLA